MMKKKHDHAEMRDEDEEEIMPRRGGEKRAKYNAFGRGEEEEAEEEEEEEETKHDQAGVEQKDEEE